MPERMVRSISFTLITARTPYKTVKTAKLVITEAMPTDGETAWDVFINPNTVHGWRPSSVNSQPAVLARNGSAIPHMQARRNQRPTGARLRRLNQRPATESREARKPNPIINRKVQYVTGMSGV